MILRQSTRANTRILWRSNLLAAVLYRLFPPLAAHASGTSDHKAFSPRARFLAWFSSSHSTYSRLDSYQALVVASQRVRHRPATIAALEPRDNRDRGVVLLQMDYSYGIRHSYRRHHYVLRKMFILKAVWVILYTMEHSRQPAPTMITCMANACRGRHMLTVETLSPRSVNQIWGIIC
jgi:hypothetical protein